jgi:hypothetical protein
MKQRNHYNAAQNKAFISLSANPSTLISVIEITTRYKVDFRPPKALKSVLGFKSRVYHAGFIELENVVNILTVNSVFTAVEIINGSYVNGKLNRVIYSFFPNVSPGYKIVENPINLISLPLNTHSIDKGDSQIQ